MTPAIEKKDFFDPWQPGGMTVDLRRLVDYANLIYEHSSTRIYQNDIDIDFTTMLLAFLISSDPISGWFQVYVRQADIAIDDILKLKGLSHKKVFEEIPTLQTPNRPPNFKPRLTRAADSIFKLAVDLMQTITLRTPMVLDVRHIMGAYIYGPYGHEYLRKGWRFDREKDWPDSFLSEINSLNHDELERWIIFHRKTFGTPPEIHRRLSPHIATDSWTIEDQLGYRLYAYAIAKFLTNDQTKPPISISLQSPWGGGKTSLMRMVRNELDTKAAEPEKTMDLEIAPAIKELLKFLKKHSKFKTNNHKPEIPEFQSNGYQVKPCVTIWFNAWRYESTEQVWAGLADSIVRGIANRMDRMQREWFFLRLNLRRHDPDSIRRWIYKRILTYLWKQISPWLWASLIGIATSIMLYIYNSYAGLLGVAASLGPTAIKSIREKSSVEDEPTDVGLGKYVKVPDYNEKLGFIHHVVEDLQIVLDTIPPDCRRIVIFIDDLDRCSPTNVAQVVEGINLFLAGGFKDCRFVIGMDAEMVAAALEVAHSDVILKLPKYSRYMPIGWRFMDKFVQLPIVIPPIGSELQKYVDSLFIIDKHQEDKLLLEIPTLRDDKKEKQEENKKLKNYNTEIRNIIQESSHRIDRSSDQDKEVRDQVSQAASYFSNNPRDIKRFVNMLRFHRFLRESMLAAKKENVPSLEQLQRWTVLLLKWPGVVRWLYWSSDRIGYKMSSEQKTNPMRERLKLLETWGLRGLRDQNYWEEQLRDIMKLEDDTVPWIYDENLTKFFGNEGKLQESERISASAGAGLY
jgi:KAP family P-loop domain